jgi:hypothetical protein
MFDTPSHDQTIWMCTILWAIWHARQKAIYENIFQSPLSTHHFVESFLSDINQTKVEKVGKASKDMAPKPPRWLHPPADMVKINTDAGVARDGSGGVVAAVARSDAGVFLGASVVFIQCLTEPETQEAMAVREGINLALDLIFPKIKVATYCLMVVKALKEENLGVYTHIIQEINSSIAGFVEVEFSHESRLSNSEPHILAKLDDPLCHWRNLQKRDSIQAISFIHVNVHD